MNLSAQTTAPPSALPGALQMRAGFVLDDQLRTSTKIEVTYYQDLFGSTCSRITAPIAPRVLRIK